MVNVFFETSFLEYPDNKSLAVVVSFSGCPHHCADCHSPLSQVYEKPNAQIYAEYIPILTSTYYSFDNYMDLYCAVKHLCDHNNTKTVVLSGGDPLFDCNEEIAIALIECLKDYKICVYTGYDIGEIKDKLTHLKDYNVIYKCGSYNRELKVQSEKNDYFMQLASTNQNFYDSNFNQLSQNGKLQF